MRQRDFFQRTDILDFRLPTFESSATGPYGIQAESHELQASASSDILRLGTYCQPKAGCFEIVSHQEILSRERWRVPGLPRQGPEATQLFKPLRLRIHKNDLAALSHEHQKISDKQDLPVPILPILPLQFTGSCVQAGENAVVQSIKMPVM